MRCIFCKEDSSASRSIEHIIPESLGCKAHILPADIVCDKCNNYFAREVEKPFLEDEYIKTLRFDQGIKSKKGIVPPMQAILNNKHIVRLWKDTNTKFAGHIDVDPIAFESIMSSNKGTVIFPALNDQLMTKTGIIVSRFVGKVAIEAFAQMIINSEYADSVDQFINDIQFGPLRNHVRKGFPKEWDCHTRRIYDAHKKWWDFRAKESYQVMNEYEFLLTEKSELYFILAIFGIEYTINMGGSDMDGYVEWLRLHNDESPCTVANLIVVITHKKWEEILW